MLPFLLPFSRPKRAVKILSCVTGAFKNCVKLSQLTVSVGVAIIVTKVDVAIGMAISEAFVRITIAICRASISGKKIFVNMMRTD